MDDIWVFPLLNSTVTLSCIQSILVDMNAKKNYIENNIAYLNFDNITYIRIYTMKFILLLKKKQNGNGNEHIKQYLKVKQEKRSN